MDQTVELTHISDTIRAISIRDIVKIAIPVDIYLQEAENLALWCIKDQMQLMNIGMSADISADLRLRAQTLRSAQTHWIEEKNTVSEIQQKWEITSKQACVLQDELLYSFRYAFRNKPKLLPLVKSGYKRKKHTVLIQDLYDLSILGMKYQDLLIPIDFDLNKLNLAKTLSEQAADRFAKLNCLRMQGNESKLFRDKAYIYLKQLVDEVCCAGKYLFRNDPNRYQGYTSEFIRRKNNNRNHKKTDSDQL